MNEQLQVALITIAVIILVVLVIILSILLTNKCMENNETNTYNYYKKTLECLETIRDYTKRQCHLIAQTNDQKNINKTITPQTGADKVKELLKSLELRLAKDESTKDFPMYLVGAMTENGQCVIKTLNNKEEYSLLEKILMEDK